MFGIGTQELIIILVIALLILGPKQLPELAKTIGKGLSELRRAMDGVKDTVNPSSVLNRMMEEEDKKEKAKKETAKKSAADETPKADSTPSDAGANADERVETTKRNQNKKDAAADDVKKTPDGDTELKG
jgi:sec-independent protein translocase protein TatB